MLLFIQDSEQINILKLLFNNKCNKYYILKYVLLFMLIPFSFNFILDCMWRPSLHQPSVSRIIVEISELLAGYLGIFIKFPNTRELMMGNKRQFFEVAGFPDVVGCIDCTHIPIKSPGGAMAEGFRNRKGFMSLNVQVVCGPNLEFLNIVIRWPGSAHDNRIFENSGVMVSFEEGRRSGILLGDSGYGQKPYLFTPVPNSQNEEETRYNRTHVKTRNIVERSFGAWKRKFSCLSKKLNTKLKTTTRIIAACAVLHNVALRYGQDDNFEFHDRVVPVEALEDRPRGRAIRAAFIERHFRILNILFA